MRLIDADALKLSHCKECTLYPNNCLGDDCDWESIAHINMMPTVDAVPVVRCKDCKYYRGYAGVVDGYCYMAEWYKRYQYPDDFCSRAERKEECSR